MKLSHLSLIACLLASANAMALSTDRDQPIYIDSDSQQLDMQSNKVTFIGDVKLKQGSININADKVIVYRNPNDGAIKEIEGYGNLATFSQLTDDGKTLYGEAKELYYKMADDQLTMINQALLRQDWALAETAAYCGFSDQSHMTRVFSNKLNVTPLKYRKS